MGSRQFSDAAEAANVTHRQFTQIDTSREQKDVERKIRAN